jgi:hypothetical protein
MTTKPTPASTTRVSATGLSQRELVALSVLLCGK